MAAREYLDPAALALLGNMHVRAKTLVEGILSGMHRSPHRGGAVEFAEYIEYSPGHEIRHIDWRVFGKSDKYYVKQFQDETNLRCYLVMDGSGSMNFQSEEAPTSKLDYVAMLAAAFAFLLVQQGDAVGLLGHDAGGAPQFLRAAAKRSHLDDIFFLLDELPGAGTMSLDKALMTIAEHARPRSIVMVFGDFLDVTEETLTTLAVLKKRRYDVVAFHVLDPAELTLPFEGLTLFEGLEDDGTLLADPDDLRERYVETMKAHLARVRDACERAQIDYVRFSTTEPLEEVALRFLRGRQ